MDNVHDGERISFGGCMRLGEFVRLHLASLDEAEVSEWIVSLLCWMLLSPSWIHFSFVDWFRINDSFLCLRTITCSQMDALCTELAKTYLKDHKLSDEAAAKSELMEKLAATRPKAHGTTVWSHCLGWPSDLHSFILCCFQGTSKTGGVGRMTDASKYTGSHKERFDESGKGKGKEGRTDTVSNDGYVGNYKGAGTYDKKA